MEHQPFPLQEKEMLKSLTWLLECILTDVSIRCGTDTHRDYLTISRRIKHEGLSFLTIALPSFGQDFERSLESGKVDPSFFLGFKKNGALPAFMQGLLGQVFDPGDGRLVDKPSEDCILSIRQLCLMFKKISLPCSPRRERRTLREYVNCERDLTGAMEAVPEELYTLFGTVSDVLWSETLSSLSSKIEKGELLPGHGPGATAEKIFGNSKYRLTRWSRRLEALFPFDAFGHPCLSAEWDETIQLEEVSEPGEEPPVRVITVPKTLKGPRVIAIEPVCMQYIQQGVSRELVRVLESHPLTKGHVNFRDQRINRNHAFRSSRSGVFSTMDMKEASDRVHKDCVYRMLKSVPLVRDGFFACRSHSAALPDGTVVPLNKFASMGSALCFPAESMVFYTLCICALLRELSLRPTRRNIQWVSRLVYVYGDDIIVPADKVPAVTEYLESFALKVNIRKTFYTGMFRESCGMDAYNGVNVTPVYVRHLPPCGRRDASAIVSYVSLANQLYFAGWWGTAQRVRELVETVIGFELPHVLETASCLGWRSVCNRYSIQRFSKDYHAPEVRSIVVKEKDAADPLSGYAALMKFFLKVGEEPIRGKHLERYVRPGSAIIKYRWCRPC